MIEIDPRLFLLRALSATGADVGGVASIRENGPLLFLIIIETSYSEIPVSTEWGTFLDWSCGEIWSFKNLLEGLISGVTPFVNSGKNGRVDFVTSGAIGSLMFLQAVCALNVSRVSSSCALSFGEAMRTLMVVRSLWPCRCLKWAVLTDLSSIYRASYLLKVSDIY